MSLDDIRAREQAATEGPWRSDEDGWIEPEHPVGGFVISVTTSPVGCADYVTMSDADRDFIANARTDIPKLIAALDAVLERCDGWQAAWDEDCVGDGAIVAADFRSAITEALQ